MKSGGLSKPRSSWFFGVGPADDLLGIKTHHLFLKTFTLRRFLQADGLSGHPKNSNDNTYFVQHSALACILAQVLAFSSVGLPNKC